MKSDKVGAKKYTGLRRPETSPASSSVASKQATLYASGKSRASPSPRVQSISLTNESQFTESHDAADSCQESVAKNGSPSVFPKSQNVASPNSQKSVSPQSRKVAHAQKVGPLSLKNRIHAGRVRETRKGESESSDLQYLIEEGPLSFRAIALLGGFFMILASILDLIDQDAADLSAMNELITVFLWIFGIIIVTLEGRPFHIQIPFLYTFLVTFFGFFKFVWGRGFFYFVGGCLQFFLFTKYDMVSGIFFMLLGIISIISGYKASVKLAGLRNSISNRSDIKYLFHSFDKDRDGLLNADEFRDMMTTMDQNVDYNAFVAALSAIDVDNNGMVSIKDMERWYIDYSENDLPPGMNCCSTSARYDQRAQLNNIPDLTQSPNAHLLA